MRSLLLTSLLLVAPATSQNCFYVPDNVASTGACNVIPFGDANPASPSWANQKYQTLIPAAQLGSQRGLICELGFAPCGSGLRQFTTLKIQMAHTTAATLNTTFANNLTGAVTVLDVRDYYWTNVANTWNRIGLQRSFVYNGTDNLVVDIEVTGVGMPGGTAGMHRGTTIERLFAVGWVGSPPATGSAGLAAAKIEVCLDVADLWTFGRGCPGSNTQTPALTYSGSASIGNVFSTMLSGALPNAAAILVTGFRNDMAGPLPLPWDMAPIGAPGCNLYVDPVVFQATGTDANGNATMRFPVPQDRSLLCARVYQQWFVFDRAANTGGLVSSNYGRVLIGS